jgi:DNA polymerase-3 subunit delta'
MFRGKSPSCIQKTLNFTLLNPECQIFSISKLTSIYKFYTKIGSMNWNILGNEWAVQLLKSHVANQKLRHAYLFTGPQGVGRRTLALRLSQAINCLQPPSPGEFCGTCANCKRFAAMQHPDLTVIQAEQEGGTLKVDQVRDLQHTLALSPYEAAYRVALLLRFEEAHPSAENALLKILEEPPAQVILLLTASSLEVVLPTTISRCEVIRMAPMSIPGLESELKTIWPEEGNQARMLAHFSGGRPGYALHLKDHPEVVEQRHAWLEEHARLIQASRADRFSFAEKLSNDKESSRQVLITWLSYWRDILLKATGAEAPITNLDLSHQIEEQATRLSTQEARTMVAAIQRTLDYIDRNVNLRLALEVLLLDLPRMRSTKSV